MTPLGSTIGDVLAAHAARDPTASLLIAPETGRTLTYGELARQARRLAAYLEKRGVASGATIGLHLHNGYQTTLLFLGLMSAGYVVAPFNLLSQAGPLAAVIEHSEAALVFGCAAHAAVLEAALARIARPPAHVIIDIDATDIFGGVGDGEAAMRPHPAGAGDDALLMYTSGTTGTPKGVLLTHANLLAGAGSVAAWHTLTPADRVLSSLPLYHINGQVIGTITPFLSGGSIVSPHRFSARDWWGLVERYHCTWLNMVPTIIVYLLADPAPRRFDHVRFGRSASAPLPPDQHRAFEAQFGIPVIEAMGMTECASVVFCNPHDERRRYGSPGLPCGVEAGIIDRSGTLLGTGETGEVVLRGPNVMRGYFKDPAKTAEAIGEGGWLRTGDLGNRDADGFYFITGRLKELIIKGGENIAPREIDEALMRHPSVMHAAAVGVPDVAYGQEIAAAVVMKPGVAFDEKALAAWCVKELGKYKTPKYWRAVDELPAGPSGKVQRMKLIDVFDV